MDLGNKSASDASDSGVDGSVVGVALNPRPERRFIPAAESSLRHVDFHIQVDEMPPQRAQGDRAPLTLALVLDRSGSMEGGKLSMARKAALAVLDRLTERDRVAVVVFDNVIDTLQPVAPVTAEVKAHVRAALERVQARANTALHEGWLTGCHAIAAGTAPGSKESLARCFLLTDGLANVGIVDPEHIAAQAAGIREQAGVGTSTFGVGADYNEALLGPLAVAGGGQFHHLRTPAEIANTFIGELGALLAVAARNVRLQLDVDPDVSVEVVSAYWSDIPVERPSLLSIPIGDLLGGEERHVVARFGFPPQARGDGYTLRARLAWSAGGMERQSAWREMGIVYADHATCENEPRDADVMYLVGLHTSDRAQQQALRLSQSGDLEAARRALHDGTLAVASYASTSSALGSEVNALRAFEIEMESGPLPSMSSKERYFRSQSRSRGQKDQR